MSAANDVAEMEPLSIELADRLVGKGAQMKARVGAVAGAIGVSANRALEFMKGKARRVDAWEKENAKRQVAELRERERIARENAHLDWLRAEIARSRAPGTEFRRVHGDGLEHLLRVARGEAGSVAVHKAADLPDIA